jgi:hypothetical protein
MNKIENVKGGRSEERVKVRIKVNNKNGGYCFREKWNR